MRKYLIPALAAALITGGFGACKAMATPQQDTVPAEILAHMPVEALIDSIRSKPNSAPLRRALAQAFIKKGLTIKAVEQAKAAIMLAGQNAEDLTILGDAHRFSGNCSAAILAYKNALSITPTSATAFAGLSLSYAAIGDYQSAITTGEHGLNQIADIMGRKQINDAIATIRSQQTMPVKTALAQANLN